MKISIQVSDIKVAITTDCGGEIYSYSAGRTSTVIDVLALLGSAGEITTAVIEAVKAAETTAKSQKQQD